MGLAWACQRRAAPGSLSLALFYSRLLWYNSEDQDSAKSIEKVTSKRAHKYLESIPRALSTAHIGCRRIHRTVHRTPGDSVLSQARTGHIYCDSTGVALVPCRMRPLSLRRVSGASAERSAFRCDSASCGSRSELGPCARRVRSLLSSLIPSCLEICCCALSRGASSRSGMRRRRGRSGMRRRRGRSWLRLPRTLPRTAHPPPCPAGGGGASAGGLTSSGGTRPSGDESPSTCSARLRPPGSQSP